MNWGSGKRHWWVAVAVAVVANLGWAGDVWIGPVPVSLLSERIRVVLRGQRSKRGGRDNSLVVLRLALRYRVSLRQCLDGQVQCMRAVLVVCKGCLPAEASCVLTQAIYLERGFCLGNGVLRNVRCTFACMLVQDIRMLVCLCGFRGGGPDSRTNYSS